MNPQMHMGVSGPGVPQVSQAGVMMGGMPPGAGGPSQHALQHLNPGAAQQAAFLQNQQMCKLNIRDCLQVFVDRFDILAGWLLTCLIIVANPNLQQMQQQQIFQQHRQAQAARQALMAQQYSGNMQMPNGMQMSQAQAAQFAMRNPMARPVNLTPHLQQAQQQVAQQQQMTEQQQAHQHQVSNCSHECGPGRSDGNLGTCP